MQPDTLKCSSCGKLTAGQMLSGGCVSAKCDNCFASPAAAAAATHVPAPRRRGSRQKKVAKRRRTRKS